MFDARKVTLTFTSQIFSDFLVFKVEKHLNFTNQKSTG